MIIRAESIKCPIVSFADICQDQGAEQSIHQAEKAIVGLNRKPTVGNYLSIVPYRNARYKTFMTFQFQAPIQVSGALLRHASRRLSLSRGEINLQMF